MKRPSTKSILLIGVLVSGGCAPTRFDREYFMFLPDTPSSHLDARSCLSRYPPGELYYKVSPAINPIGDAGPAVGDAAIEHVKSCLKSIHGTVAGSGGEGVAKGCRDFARWNTYTAYESIYGSVYWTNLFRLAFCDPVRLNSREHGGGATYGSDNRAWAFRQEAATL
jgi:hypothetical protein